MKIHRMGVTAVLVGIVASACGSDDMTMMSDYGADMDLHLSALRSELATHSTEIAAAPDVDGMGQAETAHRQRNDNHMGKMDMVMGGMMSCTDNHGNRFDHGAFSEMMKGMRTECDRHRDAMRDLPDLETRRAEEARHQDAMKNELDGMHEATGAMMSMGGAYSCDHCTHCGM